MSPQGTTFPYVFTHFKWSYLGIFAPQVWVFCVLNRNDVDYGTTALLPVVYLAIAVGMILFVLVGKLTSKSKRLEELLSWLPAIGAAATTCLLVYPFSTSAQTSMAAAIIGGVCLAGMYLSWAPFYAKLDIRNAVACVFAAMALGCVLKLWIDLTPSLPATMILTIVPLLSPFMLKIALHDQPPVDVEPQIYFDSARSSFPVKILVGVAVCSFIIGVAPEANPLVSFAPFEICVIVRHSVEVLIAGAALWWVFCFHGRLHFTNLWRAIMVITATGLLLLPNIGPDLAGWAVIMITIAQTLLVALLWATLADAAHHSSASPYIIFGCAWTVYALSVAVGQYLGQMIAIDANSTFIIALLAYALTLTAILVLDDRSFIESRLFTDLDIPTVAVSMYDSIDEGCARLGRQYNLTDREVEIVKLLCKGRSKNYIAETLFISENTVRSHSRHIYQKLNVHSKQDIMDMLSEGESPAVHHAG